MKIKSKHYDYLAPDTSEIRLLLTESDGKRASMAHCTLPPCKISLAAKHRSVEELWYFTAGLGELWLHDGISEVIHALHEGVAVAIKPGTAFQFRNLSKTENLEFIVTTIPHWPGADEAIIVEGKWSFAEV